MIWRALPWLREVGVFILTVSLLFLPWYLDPEPEPGQSAIVTGIEFLAGGSLMLIAGYSFSLLAYFVSRFTSRKGIGFFLFVVASFLYFFLQGGASSSLSLFGLSRSTSSMGSMLIRTLIGGHANFVGLVALGIGLFASLDPVEE